MCGDCVLCSPPWARTQMVLQENPQMLVLAVTEAPGAAHTSKPTIPGSVGSSLDSRGR